MTTDSTANRTDMATPAREMAQQAVVAARDSDCFPQGFVRLVGYRHSDIRPFSWIKAKPMAAPSLAQAAPDITVPIG